MDAGAGLDVGLPLADLAPAMVLDRLASPWGHGEHVPEYASARAEGAAWMRDDVEGRADLGRDLLLIEEMFDEALDAGEPSLADMGVEAWDRATGLIDPEEDGPGDSVERRMRRMLQPMTIEQLQEEAPVEREAAPEPDAGSWRRAADLIEAIQRLDAHQGRALPPALQASLGALRARLARQLRGERAHDATLDRRLGQSSLSASALPSQLRRRITEYLASGQYDADGVTVRVLPGHQGEANPYLQAIETALAEEQRHVDEAPIAEADALGAVRLRAQQTAARALTAGPDAQAALAAELDRLFAEEVRLTDGRPWRSLPASVGEAAQVDTLALRKAMADLPRQSLGAPTGAGAWTARADLPEVPITGPDGLTIGALRAGDHVSARPGEGDTLEVDLGEGEVGRLDPRWVQAAGAPEGPRWPAPTAPVGNFRPAYTEKRQQPLGAPPPPADLTLAQDPPAPAPAPAPAVAAPRGADPERKQISGPALQIGRVQAQGLVGADGAKARPVLQRALDHLEGRLAARLAGDRALARQLLSDDAQISQVDVPITIRLGGNVDDQARALADQIAEALLRSARSATRR